MNLAGMLNFADAEHEPVFRGWPAWKRALGRDWVTSHEAAQRMGCSDQVARNALNRYCRAGNMEKREREGYPNQWRVKYQRRLPTPHAVLREAVLANLPGTQKSISMGAGFAIGSIWPVLKSLVEEGLVIKQKVAGIIRYSEASK